jgi:hypothetical protein
MNHQSDIGPQIGVLAQPSRTSVTFLLAPPRLLLASMSYLHVILISVTAPHPAVLSSCLHHVPARVRVRARSPRPLCTRRRASGVLATRPLARRRWRSSFSASPLVFSPPVCPPYPSRRSLPVPHRVGSRALAVLGFHAPPLRAWRLPPLLPRLILAPHLCCPLAPFAASPLSPLPSSRSPGLPSCSLAPFTSPIHYYSFST